MIQQKIYLQEYGKPDSEWLFPGETSHLSRTQAHLKLSEAFKFYGWTNVSSHSMRRTFITNLARGGLNPRAVAALSGHKSLQLLMTYIDVDDVELKHAVNAL